ncbi:MAG: DNA polymerase III subunit delta [Armatimonadetes bacterium]|nr:DNA polymerase III subunit delta [Armatimonadota bacterium]
MPSRMPEQRTGGPQIYLFWGLDEIRKRIELRELLDTLIPAEDQELDLEQLDALEPEVTGETILNAARHRGMFADRRVVVVWNAGRFRAPRHQATQDVLANGLAALPDYSTVILVVEAESGEDRTARAPLGDRLMAELNRIGTIRRYQAPSPEELARYLVQEAASLGKRLPPGVAASLLERVGTDPQQLIQEVRKLAAYVGDRQGITPADVAALTPPPEDDNIFHLLEAVLNGETRRTLEILTTVYHRGTSPHELLARLTRTLRQLVQVRYLLDRGIGPTAEPASIPAEILSELPTEGRIYPGTQAWQRKRLWGQAARFTWGDLHAAVDQLARTDAGTKGWEHGIEDPALALEAYVVSLCGTVRMTRPRATASRTEPGRR